MDGAVYARGMASARGGWKRVDRQESLGFFVAGSEANALQPGSSDLLLQYTGQAAGDTLNNLIIGTLYHHPHLVLRSGVADEDSPLGAEPAQLFGQRGLVAREGFERRS